MSTTHRFAHRFRLARRTEAVVAFGTELLMELLVELLIELLIELLVELPVELLEGLFVELPVELLGDAFGTEVLVDAFGGRVDKIISSNFSLVSTFVCVMSLLWRKRTTPSDSWNAINCEGNSALTL